MLKSLDDNDTIVYSNRNAGNSVVAERFTGAFNGKIYNKITANDSKTYLGYLDKLVNEYNNTCHCSFDKKLIHVNCSTLSKQIESSQKVPTFKVGDRLRIAKYKAIQEIGQKEFLLLILC